VPAPACFLVSSLSKQASISKQRLDPLGVEPLDGAIAHDHDRRQTKTVLQKLRARCSIAGQIAHNERHLQLTKELLRHAAGASTLVAVYLDAQLFGHSDAPGGDAAASLSSP
jgi:hypothetical protein